MQFATIKRETKETKIIVEINLVGKGKFDINTGVGFFDHMLEQLTYHMGADINIQAAGDLHIDQHHTVEDVGIAIGMALADIYKQGIGRGRYGFELLPMDDSLVSCAIDFSGRPFFAWDVCIPTEKVGTFDTELTEEFFRAVVMNAGLTAHFSSIRGKNSHHIIESLFKAFARALYNCFKMDDRYKHGVPSTKGMLGD